MIEEYSMDTGVIVRRAWKKKQDVLCTQPMTDDLNKTLFNWDVELGELPSTTSKTNDNDFMVKESNTAVSVTRFSSI